MYLQMGMPYICPHMQIHVHMSPTYTYTYRCVTPHTSHATFYLQLACVYVIMRMYVYVYASYIPSTASTAFAGTERVICKWYMYIYLNIRIQCVCDATHHPEPPTPPFAATAARGSTSHMYIHLNIKMLCVYIWREVGGWGRVPFSKNLMNPTPCRKWYLTTGRRAH